MKTSLLLALPFLAFLQPAADGQTAAVAPSPVTVRPALAADYGKLSLSFEANQGQTDPQVKFLSRGNGYSLFLTDSAAVLALSKKEPGAKGKVRTDVVRMELAGAARASRISGTDPLPGISNYFIGNDPAKWHADVPTYAKVKYAEVYPGIDLVYYGNRRQLEYDFVVAPGADPKPMRLQFRGSEKLKINADGSLTIIAGNGEIAFHKPIIYQVKDGRRQPVVGQFALLTNNTVCFTVGSYDHSRELVIDPTLEYSTYLGGTLSDEALGIAVDSTGAAYVTGIATSTNFPVTSGVFQNANNEDTDRSNGFVTKFNAAGTALVYSTYLGGAANDCSNNRNTLTQGDYGAAIAVDAEGNAYITGTACAATFPVTTGAFQTKFNTDAASNAFITKLNPTGSKLIYSTFLGGGGDYYSGDFGTGIAIDSKGDAYVTGQTSSTNFPVTTGAFQTKNNNAFGTNNAFVTEMNPTGTALIYSTYLGGGGLKESAPGDSGQGIAINAAGNAYVTGYTYSSNFPVTSGAYQATNKAFSGGGSNAFVTELNTTGTALVFSTYLGGTYNSSNPLDSAYGIALDGAGNVYVAGGTGSTTFPVTTGAYQTTNKAAPDYANGFVTKLSPTGKSLVYSTYLGGSGHSPCGGERIEAIALDSFGNAYLTGYTCSANFPVTSGAYQTTNKGLGTNSNDAFLTELNPAGAALNYSTYFGGNGVTANDDGDVGYAIAFAGGNVYFAGATESSNFPVTTGAFQTTNKATAGNSNAFVARFAVATATTTPLTTDGTPQKEGVKVTFTADVAGGANTGTPTGTVDFSVDGGAGIAETLDDTGHAVYSTSALTPGTHSVVASYLGDAEHLPSTSNKLSQTIYGPVATLAVVSGSGQTGPVNSAYPQPLVVIAKDAEGDVVPGITITFSGTGLKFSTTTPATGTNGEASVTATPTQTGSLTATASAGGSVKAVTFTLTATGGIVAEPGVSQTITISEATSGATVYYTTNGSTPTTASTKYTGPITITASETLKFIAVLPGDTNSAVRTVADTIQ